MRKLPNSSAALDAGLQTALVEVVRRHVPDVDGIYLFGSVAQGRTRPGSDVDVALLLPPRRKLSPDELLTTMSALESLTHRTVDLSVLDTQTQLVHAKEVVTTGVRLFARSPERIRAFEMHVLSQYARFLEDRAPVAAAYTLHADG
ncbi:MAG: nucleotidyltransferase domain-containing protein [Acidobacteriota bacterium]